MSLENNPIKCLISPVKTFKMMTHRYQIQTIIHLEHGPFNPPVYIAIMPSLKLSIKLEVSAKPFKMTSCKLKLKTAALVV